MGPNSSIEARISARTDGASAHDVAKAPPGPEILPRKLWSPAENWAWAEILRGRVADFDARCGFVDPMGSAGWSQDRSLRSSFLETILSCDSLRSGIPRPGVRIRGARVTEQLVLANGFVPHDLRLERFRFESAVDLRGLEVRGELSFGGSHFAETVSMNGLVTDGNLDMTESFAAKQTILLGARVGRQIVLSGATFEGVLDMEGVEAGSSMLLFGVTAFGELILADAKVGGQLSVIDAILAGPVDMEGIEVAGDILMRGAVFTGSVRLDSARVGTDLDLCGAVIASLDLSETMILGELRLSSTVYGSTKWAGGGRLDLRNARVGAVRDQEDSWPGRLALDGFTYAGVGAARSLEWFSDWLGRDTEYSFQPYRQLAASLYSSGERSLANSILFVGRERQRRQVRGAEWLGMTILNYTIGYGLGERYLRATWWVLGFSLLGAIVLSQCDGGMSYGLLWLVSCSFDLLVPFVEFDASHYTFLDSVTGWQKLYFYVHQIFGVLVGALLIAGFTGLTQNPRRLKGLA